MPKVLVTRLIPQPGLDRLAQKAEVIVSPLDRHLTAQELVDMSAGCLAVMSQPSNKIDAAFLDARPEVRMVGQMAVGFDNIDLPALKTRGVKASNTPGVLTAGTADLTIGLILCVTRRLIEGDRLVRAGGFKEVHPLFHLGWDLEGKTIGIYGLGRIGLAVAERAKAFGLRIIYHDVSPRTDLPAGLEARYVDFETLLQEADILCVNAPLSAETRGRFNYSVFQKMKPGAFFINSARGPIHVEADLVRALKEGLIRGAGLDVYEFEPKVHPELIGLNNVVLMPHLGSAAIEVRTRMALTAAENIVAFLEGRDLPTRIV